MHHSITETTRSFIGWLASAAQRAFDGGPSASDDGAEPSPAARIDHPTYLRRRIEIDGMASPCPIGGVMARWQARLPH